MSLNRIVADKSHRVIVALVYKYILKQEDCLGHPVVHCHVTYNVVKNIQLARLQLTVTIQMNPSHGANR